MCADAHRHMSLSLFLFFLAPPENDWSSVRWDDWALHVCNEIGAAFNSKPTSIQARPPNGRRSPDQALPPHRFLTAERLHAYNAGCQQERLVFRAHKWAQSLLGVMKPVQSHCPIPVFGVIEPGCVLHRRVMVRQISGKALRQTQTIWRFEHSRNDLSRLSRQAMAWSQQRGHDRKRRTDQQMPTQISEKFELHFLELEHNVCVHALTHAQVR